MPLVLNSGQETKVVSFFRQFYFTSCSCKVPEPLVCWRLTWLLEEHEVLACELSDFRGGRNTAETVWDLVRDLEDSNSAGGTAYVILIALFPAFDFLTQDMILNHLPVYKVMEGFSHS